jgi:hypothetical protein
MSSCYIIEFPKILDPRGNLTFLQYPDILPFEIKRVFLTYNIPGGEKRGGHAYKNQQEIIIALSGSFDVLTIMKDGVQKKFSLNRSNYGLCLSPSVWRHLENFSTNSLSLHLSDRKYDESDYIRELKNFRNG